MTTEFLVRGAHMSAEEFIHSLEVYMSNDKVKHYSREWLNAPGHHGNGYIVTDVQSSQTKGKTTWVQGDVTIADCSRSINLDFYISGEYGGAEALEVSRSNDLAKIDLIISELQEFRRVLKREAKKVKANDDDD